MVDKTDDRKQTDFERFMDAVNAANGFGNGTSAGELLCAGDAQYTFTEHDAHGLMLATFTVKQDGQERPTIYTGMISLLKAAPTGPKDQMVMMLTLRYYNDKGYQKLKVPLRQLQRLMTHPRELGSSVFCIRDGVLVKEDRSQDANQEHMRGSYAADTNQADSRVA